MQIRFEVKFKNPKRTFFIRANDPLEAFEIAKTIENVLERPVRSRSRRLDQTTINALQKEEPGEEYGFDRLLELAHMSEDEQLSNVGTLEEWAAEIRAAAAVR